MDLVVWWMWMNDNIDSMKRYVIGLIYHLDV